MQQKNESGSTLAQFSRTDLLLLLFLLPLYLAVWGKFGQKFAAGAVLSFASGGCCWLAAVVMRNPEEGVSPWPVNFAWPLFYLFPLFCPLALPLWLIPVILTLSYLVAITSFGGFRKHVFNPVALAVVVMICGYGTTASLHAVRPLEGSTSGFRIWTAGMPAARPVIEIIAAVPAADLLKVASTSVLPAIPGSSFGLVLLIASFAVAFLARQRRLWWLTAVIATATLTEFLVPGHLQGLSAMHPLLFGVIPALLLIAVADYTTLPESWAGQFISALVFAIFAVLLLLRSENILSPVYALLLTQILSPLIIDLVSTREAI